MSSLRNFLLLCFPFYETFILFDNFITGAIKLFTISIYHYQNSSQQFNRLKNVEGQGCPNISDLHIVGICYWTRCVPEHGSQNNEVRLSLWYSHFCLSNVSARKPGKVWRNPWEPSELRPLPSAGRNVQDWMAVAWCTSTDTTTGDTSGAPLLRSSVLLLTVFNVYILRLAASTQIIRSA